MNLRPAVERIAPTLVCLSLLSMPMILSAQQPDGPQTDAPPPVAPKPVDARAASSRERITVPAGTPLAIVLQNGISPRNPSPRDPVYLHNPLPPPPTTPTR